MAATALIGLQWGDEGKGKIVDALASSADIVVRCNGGSNAGHTVWVGSEKFVLHLIPGGILQPQSRCVIGNGVVVDPGQLLEEIRVLRSRGVDATGRLHLSDRAHIVLPYHRALDEAMESDRAGQKLGTTGRGIGPAYADKVSRTGLRVGDLLDVDSLAHKIAAQLRVKSKLIESYGAKASGLPEAEDLVARCRFFGEELKPYVTDTVSLIQKALRAGQEVFLEGAQGSLLDIDFGTYPFVTSSNSSIGGMLAGSGVPARAVSRVIGVAKAYTTRVGEGPFPTEESGPTGARLREKGHEFGATTGRPRRCGWFDAVATKFAVDVNGVDAIALTKSDVLGGFPSVRVCTAYRLGGVKRDEIPAQNETLRAAEPIYEDLPGWTDVSSSARRFLDLPQELKSYVGYLERFHEVPVAYVSLGPGRESLIDRSAEGRW